MSNLSLRIFEDSTYSPHSTITQKVYNLNFTYKKRSLFFDKRFGLTPFSFWPTMRVRDLERPAQSRRKRISIVQKFNDCLLLTKMRNIIDSNYTFGDSVKRTRDLILVSRSQLNSYHEFRRLIGLPIRGQRSKTNARTVKNKRNLSSPTTIKILRQLSTHQKLSVLTYTRALAQVNQDIKKFRFIQELKQLSRYRPKGGQSRSPASIERHYEKIYKKIMAAKKRKKNPSKRR
jgi:hypothetical protein